MSLVFNSCDVLRPYVSNVDDIFKDFTSYKCRVPVSGAIILDETYERVRPPLWSLQFLDIFLSSSVYMLVHAFLPLSRSFFGNFSACWWRDGKDLAGAFPAGRRVRMKKTMPVLYVRLVLILLLLVFSVIHLFCSLDPCSSLILDSKHSFIIIASWKWILFN